MLIQIDSCKLYDKFYIHRDVFPDFSSYDEWPSASSNYLRMVDASDTLGRQAEDFCGTAKCDHPKLILWCRPVIRNAKNITKMMKIMKSNYVLYLPYHNTDNWNSSPNLDELCQYEPGNGTFVKTTCYIQSTQKSVFGELWQNAISVLQLSHSGLHNVGRTHWVLQIHWAQIQNHLMGSLFWLCLTHTLSCSVKWRPL